MIRMMIMILIMIIARGGRVGRRPLSASGRRVTAAAEKH